MNINEYIESKSKELVDNKTHKSVTFRSIDVCTMSPNSIGRMFSFCGDGEKANMELNVQSVSCKELHEKIDVFEVVFDVVKPRCRKPERLRSSLYEKGMK